MEARAVLRTAVTDDWRRWIGENLLMGSDPASIHRAMTDAGIAPKEAEVEINAAMASPYLRASERLHARLAKRDWMLESISKLRRMHPDAKTVERRHRISRDEFLREFYSQSKPVIITGMMDDWPAMEKWSLDYFAAQVGEREVEVQFGRTSDPNFEINGPKHKRKMRFGEYIDMVRAAGVTNDFYMTANNSGHNKQAIRELWQDVIQIPEYLKGEDPSEGFFWLGPAGTITPFHHDLTNNFMAQVMGRKRLKIAPSWDLSLMNNFHHCFSLVDGRDVPAAPHPAFEQPQILECILHPGEILFLPVGCIHFVRGLDITVTVSFTNFVFDNDFSTFYTTYHHL
ncbi:MAG: cupin-like domain-containing protein [Burkholderiales bacterium]|nr:cupin-like domain-containing protein [Burkholderiales bacterium]